ncbi:hypothetical protein A5725_00010 [Mycobacterium kubicae]|nr:hypothetical protein A5725_00010 [Mycobacterium kubicae]
MLFIAMILLGVATFCFGTYADLRHTEWLKSYSYLPNVLAGFTGFLIGVPVALVGLSTITGLREEKAASDRVQELTRLAWKQFRDGVNDFCSESRIDTMQSIAQSVQKHHDETFECFENYRNLAGKPTQDYQNLQTSIKNQIKPWQEPFAQMMRAVGTRQDLGMNWYAVLRDWNTVDQYVRLQRLERGLPWFNRITDSLLQQRMNPETHPMQPFFDKHEGPSSETNETRPHSMWGAFKSLYRFVDVPEEAFDKQMALNSGYFPDRPVDGYGEAIYKTAMNMRQIRMAVERIDRDDWLID